jgi:hypothetical protein
MHKQLTNVLKTKITCIALACEGTASNDILAVTCSPLLDSKTSTAV